jgi:hypothetical protein
MSLLDRSRALTFIAFVQQILLTAISQTFWGRFCEILLI